MNPFSIIQAEYSELSLHFLWVSSVILFIITFLLFTTSIVTRVRRSFYDRKLERAKDGLFHYIMEYLEGEFERERFEELFSGSGIEYIAFETIIFDLLENIEGSDVKKLQDLLKLPAVYEFHVNQLDSPFSYTRIKACNYFSYINLLDKKVIARIEEDLYSDNQMLAFSSASALMASNEVDVRSNALKAIVSRRGVSRMAILEMLYKFHNEEVDQMDEEAVFLKDLIRLADLPPGNIAIAIQGIAEIGYQSLAPMLCEKLFSNEKRWNHPRILSALIVALGSFYYDEASPGIRIHIYNKSPLVRKACVESLGKLATKENLRAIYNMLYDENFTIRYLAVKALKEAGDDGEAWLEYADKMQKLEVKPFVKSIEEGTG